MCQHFFSTIKSEPTAAILHLKKKEGSRENKQVREKHSVHRNSSNTMSISTTFLLCLLFDCYSGLTGISHTSLLIRDFTIRAGNHVGLLSLADGAVMFEVCARSQLWSFCFCIWSKLRGKNIAMGKKKVSITQNPIKCGSCQLKVEQIIQETSTNSID